MNSQAKSFGMLALCYIVTVVLSIGLFIGSAVIVSPRGCSGMSQLMSMVVPGVALIFLIGFIVGHVIVWKRPTPTNQRIITSVLYTVIMVPTFFFVGFIMLVGSNC